jgi:hypothetical protein
MTLERKGNMRDYMETPGFCPSAIICCYEEIDNEEYLKQKKKNPLK